MGSVRLGAVAGIALSALLVILGRKRAAIFVGLLPATVAALGVFHSGRRSTSNRPEVGAETAADREADYLTGMSREERYRRPEQAAERAKELESPV